MRNDLELMQLIENYLQDKMNASEKEAFEKRIQADAALQKEVELQRKLMKGIERVGLKQSAAAALKKYKFKTNFKNWGLTGLSIAILAAGSVFVYNNVKPHHNENEAYELPELNEQGEKLWSDADKYLPLQNFELDAGKDTVVETADGIVIAIPANSFLDANGKPVSGEVNLEVKEALKASDILKAGLTTKSGDQLLETGGMFYINARKNGASLKIDSKNGLRAQIPTDEAKPGMQLFEGKRLPNGTIDWVNPKPLSKDLIPVDIHSLNFYPPHYLDSLKSWGYDSGNKKFTDSLYYSFGKTTVTDWNEHTNERADKIFRQNCAVCHSLGTNYISGPGLKNICYRVPSEDWLSKWIQNNYTLIQSGDPYANKIFNENGKTPMPIFVTNDEDIKLLIQYLKLNDHFEGAIGDGGKTDSSRNGIDPLKVKAIWDDHFQNTLLSTKEFEERMLYIHQYCDDKILEEYITHLDKNLSAIDSTIAYSKEFLGKYDGSKFIEFAKRGDGKVKNGDKNTVLLTAYFQKRYKLYSEELTKVQNKYNEELRKLDEEAQSKNKEYSEGEEKRISQNYQEEYKLNLKDAYRQLGITVEIYSTGWKNVDKYVEESTMARTTLNYTDPNTGKKAVIEYNPLTVNVTDYKNYDRTLVYLLPDELNSFMRLENKNEVFEEKVTNLMRYKLVCIAYKGEDAFYFSEDNVKSGKHSILLIKTDNATIQNNINQLGKLSQVKAMNDELNYISFSKAEKKRQEQLEQREVFLSKVRKVVFPCETVKVDTTSPVPKISRE